MTPTDRERLIEDVDAYAKDVTCGLGLRTCKEIIADLRRIDRLEKALEWGYGSADPVTRQKCKEALEVRDD